MAIKSPRPPDRSVQEAIQGISQLEPNRSLTEGTGGTAPNISHPLEAFTIDPRDITEGAGLAAAKATGWRYLVRESAPQLGGGPASIAESVAEVSEKGGIHTFSHRQKGWLAQRTEDAMESAVKLPEVSSGDYDIRMLRMPGIQNTDALWLKDSGGAEDLIVPIASKSPLVIAGKAYPAEEFLTLMRQLAKTMPFDDRPQPLPKAE